MMVDRLKLLAWELWLPVLLVTAWWFGSAGSTSVFFPPLSAIAKQLRSDWLFTRVGSDLVPSLVNTSLGYAAAVTIGVGLGVVLGRVPALRHAIDPLLQFMRALPTVALVPAAVILLGVGRGEKVFIIALAAVWPVLLNTVDGVRGVEPVLNDVARSFRIRGMRRLIRITVPGASPKIIAGMRTSLAISIIMLVVSEMYAASNGIGFYILSAQRTFLVSATWAGTIVLGVVGYLLNVAFRRFESRALRWHPSMRDNPHAPGAGT